MPKVSIIVPVYDVEKYLSKCLDSLVFQTLDDFEVIVVNDGTPDNSQAIIDDYAEKYPNIIKPFIKENGGLSDARNFGIEKASGEYIAFVDSDDYVKVYMFEKLYEQAKKTNADVVYSPILYVKEYNGIKTYFPERIFDNSNIKSDPYILRDANSYACNKIYKRSFWVEHNFKFPCQAFEDSALIYNVLLCADVISCYNDPMYFYNQKREGAITAVIDDKVFDIFKSVNSIVDFYKKTLGNSYSYYEPHVAYICIKHLWVRINHIRTCKDIAIKKRFLEQTFEFLDKNFPHIEKYDNYKEIKRAVRRKIGSIFIGKNYKKTFSNYMLRNSDLFEKLKKIAKKVIKTLKNIKNRNTPEKIKATKRKYIQKNGLQVLVHVQEMLDSLGIVNFADFGTMLGLIREGRLLRHDMDMDIGVIAEEKDKDIIRLMFEKNGYKLWRSYSFDNKTVEDSFRFKRVKVDINYYEHDGNQSKTWLFYKKPDTEYNNPFERNVVEMRYSKINGTKKINIDGYDINLPEDPETLLKEKYGENWRIPDTDWIYWLSPAATPIDSIGTFVTYTYKNFPFTRIAEDDSFDTATLQQLELEILKEVDRVCTENNLTYYLGEGTLLGAIRHKGFIPWDDDVDILMPREDYDKFIEIAPQVIGSMYEVQHYKLIKNYWSIFMKVRLKDTSTYYQSTLKHLTDNNGPYIDIFPLDRIDNVPIKKLQENKKQLTIYRKILSYKLKETRPKTRKTKLIYPRIYFNSIPKIYEKLDYLYHKYDAPNGKYYINYASYYNVSKQVFPVEYYGTPKRVDFNGYKLCVPCQAEKILSSIYRDYMAMPSLTARKVKHSFIQKKIEKIDVIPL